MVVLVASVLDKDVRVLLVDFELMYGNLTKTHCFVHERCLNDFGYVVQDFDFYFVGFYFHQEIN